MEGSRGRGGGEVEGSLHASGAAPGVAVVEVEAFALEDEGADAILDVSIS